MCKMFPIKPCLRIRAQIAGTSFAATAGAPDYAMLLTQPCETLDCIHAMSTEG